MKEPLVHVGILSAVEVNLFLRGDFYQGDTLVTGPHTLSVFEGQIIWNEKQYSELFFEPVHPEAADFELGNVPIGIDFHWERGESQRFRGALHIGMEHDRLVVINTVPVEEYLTSVISSEMSATASLALLKAHAVISRSWLLAQIGRRAEQRDSGALSRILTTESGEEELVKWFDRENHTLFDVCADDHCQRYQGITRAYTPQVETAVRETYGEVLMYKGTLCDARFSKCCGGALEKFSTCWEDVDYPYLTGKRDWNADLPDLTGEEAARRWILSEPEAFCRVGDKRLLSRVLTNYDQETPDFYRWKVTYPGRILSDLIFRRLGIDFGEIKDLIPLQRGVSGRISRLRIVGSRRTMILGKELLIRKVLSESHLYSSAFIVERSGDADPVFTLYGAGWGHGVGLCQIGAAVMGEQGYDYKEILQHYYVDADIEKTTYCL